MATDTPRKDGPRTEAELKFARTDWCRYYDVPPGPPYCQTHAGRWLVGRGYCTESPEAAIEAEAAEPRPAGDTHACDWPGCQGQCHTGDWCPCHGLRDSQP